MENISINSTTTTTTTTSEYVIPQTADVQLDKSSFLLKKTAQELFAYALLQKDLALLEYLTTESEVENDLKALNEMIDEYYIVKFKVLLYEQLSVFFDRYLSSNKKDIALDESEDIIEKTDDYPFELPNGNIKAKNMVFHRQSKQRSSEDINTAISPIKILKKMQKNAHIQYSFLDYQKYCEKYVSQKILSEYKLHYVNESLLSNYLRSINVTQDARCEILSINLSLCATNLLEEVNKLKISCIINANDKKVTLSKSQPDCEALKDKLKKASDLSNEMLYNCNQKKNFVNVLFENKTRKIRQSVKDFIAQKTNRPRQNIRNSKAENLSYEYLLLLNPHKLCSEDLMNIMLPHPEDVTRQLTLSEWFVLHYMRNLFPKNKQNSASEQARLRKFFTYIATLIKEPNIFTAEHLNDIRNKLAVSRYDTIDNALLEQYISTNQTSYSEADIKYLMIHYLKNTKLIKWMSTTNIEDAEALSQSCRVFSEQRQVDIDNEVDYANKILFPLKLENNQWGLLYLNYEPNSLMPNRIFYFSLLQSELPPQVRNALPSLGIHDADDFPIKVNGIQIDNSDTQEYLSGAFLIEIIRVLADTGNIPVNIKNLKLMHMQHFHNVYPNGLPDYVPDNRLVMGVRRMELQREHQQKEEQQDLIIVDRPSTPILQTHARSLKAGQSLEQVAINIHLGLEALYSQVPRLNLDLINTTNVTEAILKTCDSDFIFSILQNFNITLPKELVDLKLYSPFDWTLLHLAMYQGQMGLVDMLFEQGANFHLRDVNNVTPATFLVSRIIELTRDLERNSRRLDDICQKMKNCRQAQNQATQQLSVVKYGERQSLEQLTREFARLKYRQENLISYYRRYKSIFSKLVSQLYPNNWTLMAEGKLAQSRYFLKLNELTLKLIKAFSSKTSFISIDDIQSLEELLIAIKQQIQYAYIDQEEFHLYAVVDTWLKDQYGHNDFPNNYPAEIKNILEELITLHKEVLNKDNPSSKLVCGTQIQAVRSQWMDMLDRAIIAEERAEEAMRIAEQAREAERCAKESERLALQRGDQEQQKRLTTEQEVAALFIKYRSNKITKKQYDHAMARLVQSFTCMQEQEPTVQVAEEATTATQATTFGIFGTESANTSKPRESAEAKQEPSEDVEAEMYEKHI